MVEDKNHSRPVIALMLVFVLVQGCAFAPRMDRPYDPDFSKGESLFQQYPNWDSEAERVCGSHLPPEQRKPYHSLEC